MRRIGIDVRYLSHGLVGGVHTYVRHFVTALIDLASGHELVLYADSKARFELDNLPENVQLRVLPWYGPQSTIQHDFLMRRQMERDHLDVVHFPANYGLGPAGVPTIVTVHDAINLLPLAEIVRGHPKTAGTFAKMTYLHFWTRVSAARAALVLTVSRHAANDIARQSAIPSWKIVPIPHAPTPDLLLPMDQTTLDEVRRRFMLDRPFVLADALKNPATLVGAWRRLPTALQACAQMVFFSRRPDVPSAVHNAVVHGEARLLLRPSRRELIALYRMADAFVFPSWIEGFGLPILEAMTCGAPVIASDRGAIPEVAGDAALLADAEDVGAFARHLERVLGDRQVAARLRERGFARAATFSWERTAQEILMNYERVSRDGEPLLDDASGGRDHAGRLLGRA